MDEQDVRIVHVDDGEYFERLSLHLASDQVKKFFWEDSLRKNPLLSFVSSFMNPHNRTVDLGGGGVALFTHVQPGWRGRVHVVTWAEPAKGNVSMFHRALGAVMLLDDLQWVEAVISEHNDRAQSAAAKAGFQRRGTVYTPLWYSGVIYPAVLWEIDREEIGLPEVNADGWKSKYASPDNSGV